MDVIQSIVNNQSVQLIFGLALLFLFADVIVGITAAFRAHDFTSEKVAEWLDTHVMKRVVPIVLLAILGAGLAQFSGRENAPVMLQAIELATWAAAWAAILVYATETLGSLGVNVPTIGAGSRT